MTPENKLIGTFESVEGKTNVYDNGLVESFINEDAYLDVPYVIQGKKQLETIAPGKKFYVISTGKGFYRITKEARNLCATQEYSSHLAAIAMVTDHVAVKLIIDVYNKINKPVVPTKIFTEEEPAREWLKERMKQDGII
jgi:hypothetical protein